MQYLLRFTIMIIIRIYNIALLRNQNLWQYFKVVISVDDNQFSNIHYFV